MFSVVTTRQIDPDLVKMSNLSFTELIIDCLKSIGFIDIRQQGDTLTFKHNIKDPYLESFQRRYGSGTLKLDDALENYSIIISKKPGTYISLQLLANGIALLTVNYEFLFNSFGSILLVMIFNAMMILLTVFGVWSTKRKYRRKNERFLDMLEKKILELTAASR